MTSLDYILLIFTNILIFFDLTYHFIEYLQNENKSNNDLDSNYYSNNYIDKK